MDWFGGHTVYSFRRCPALAGIQAQPREVAGLTKRENNSGYNCGRGEGAISYWETVKHNNHWKHLGSALLSATEYENGKLWSWLEISIVRTPANP